MKTLTLTKEQIKNVFLEQREEVTQEKIDYIFNNYKQFIKDYPWRYKHFLQHNDFYYFFSDIEYKKKRKITKSELKNFNYKAYVEFNFTSDGYENINDDLLREMFGTKTGYVDLNKLKKITPIQKRMIIDVYENHYDIKKEYTKFLKTYCKFNINKLTVDVDLNSFVNKILIEIQKEKEHPSVNCITLKEVVEKLKEKADFIQYNINLKYNSNKIKLYVND